MESDNIKRRIGSLFRPKTELERQRMRKYAIIFPALFLSFIVAIWFIFGDGFSSDPFTSGKVNMELPPPDKAEIEGNKLKALEEQSVMEEKSRQDSILLSFTGQELPETAMPDGMEVTPVESSAQAYREVQASLDDFYIPENTGEARIDELQARIDELEMQNVTAVTQATSQPDQMELLERSYQLAAQYIGGNNENRESPEPSVKVSDEKKKNVSPVRQEKREVVSSLSDPSTARQFNTSVGLTGSVSKNTIAAVVAGDQKVEDGRMVRLRTTETMLIGRQSIPKNTSVSGVAHLNGERMEIEISSVTCAGSVYEVDLVVYDYDGQRGVNVPGCLEADALHEIGADMGSSVGSSINIATDTGVQLASDLGRGLINGVSQYLDKKLRTVKIRLKSGYKVMLKQPEEN